MIIRGIEYSCLARFINPKTNAQELLDQGIPVSTTLMHAIQDCGGRVSENLVAGAEKCCADCPLQRRVEVGEGLMGMAQRVRAELESEILG